MKVVAYSLSFKMEESCSLYKDYMNLLYSMTENVTSSTNYCYYDNDNTGDIFFRNHWIPVITYFKRVDDSVLKIDSEKTLESLYDAKKYLL